MNPTVCLVDDNKDILEIFGYFFETSGYNVIRAAGGQECFDSLRAVLPDIIILDVMMEPMDGWNVLLGIKTNPATERIPVIMVSGKRPTPDELNLYGDLFVEFIMKPVSFPQLFEAVARVTENCGTTKPKGTFTRQ
jgi:two-component system, OmpR family, response regulator